MYIERNYLKLRISFNFRSHIETQHNDKRVNVQKFDLHMMSSVCQNESRPNYFFNDFSFFFTNNKQKKKILFLTHILIFESSNSSVAHMHT